MVETRAEKGGATNVVREAGDVGESGEVATNAVECGRIEAHVRESIQDHTPGSTAAALTCTPLGHDEVPVKTR